jgi:nitroreductase
MESAFLDLLRKRRSIRQFESRTIESSKIDVLIEAAVRSPTSRGRNPWEFIVVNDRKLLNKLGNAKQHGSAFLSEAPLAIVVAADKDKSDVWTEDCSIAAIVTQLAAEELGLGSCWVQIRLRPHDAESTAESFVKELLGIPDTHVVECIIGIGYPAEHKPGHLTDHLPFAHVHRNTFGE